MPAARSGSANSAQRFGWLNQFPVAFFSEPASRAYRRIGGDGTTSRINVGANTVTRLFEVLGAGYNGGVTYDAADNSFYAIQNDSSGYIGGIGSFNMYADAGSTVTVVYNRGTFSSGSLSIGVTITGYYVNLP